MRLRSLHERRSGVSDIVATVLIVAATLIAFAAVAGYVFGTLGSGSTTANIAVTSVSINHSLAAGAAILVLSNTGTAGTSASGIILNYNGASCSLAVAGNTLVSSGATTVYVNTGAGTCIAPSAGSIPFSGYVLIANGEEATFAGMFA